MSLSLIQKALITKTWIKVEKYSITCFKKFSWQKEKSIEISCIEEIEV
jgi:hypothetical protein